MSRHLHLDPFSGAAGDMFLGLLVDLGLDPAVLAALPTRLGLTAVEVRSERAQRGAIAAARVRVLVGGAEELPAAAADEPAPSSVADGAQRRRDEVLALIDRAGLPKRAAALAHRAFVALFAAEGAVHGAPAEAVHLHEAAADDALIDVVGAALGLVELEIESVSCSVPLPVGGGVLRCAHGLLPVPVPAVVELLRGLPVVGGPVARELITPTGAALLRAVVDEFRPAPPLLLDRAGHGAGGRDDAHAPNVLRGLCGRLAAGPLARTLTVLETTLDDILPQDVPLLVERLLADGARDAFVAPVQMKKGRPGFWLTVICDPEQEQRLAERLLHDSPTLGVRLSRQTRLEWDRDVITVDTPWGPVRVKRALDSAGRPLRSQPEFEDCRRAADAGGVTADAVRRRARDAAEGAGAPAAGAVEEPP